jgi:hypothetical protein
MAGIEDLIEIFRGETINLNPFKTRSSADMNPGGKIKVGKYATTSADEAMNYASKKFPNKIMTTKVSPREFKIGQRVFNEVMRDSKTLESFLQKKEKESKQRSLFKDLKKEVNTGANGTQKYVIKKGENKGKVADINAIGNNNK